MIRLTTLFQPFLRAPKNMPVKAKDNTAKSLELMFKLGIVKQANPGFYHLLPLGLRAVEKLIKLVDDEMISIGCQKMNLSMFTSTNLWKQSERYNKTNELFIVKDHHDKKYILNPTCEESITHLVASLGNTLSQGMFPLKLYQIGPKYRDELKPKFGLLRTREFIMKDLYTFDIDLKTAKMTYDLINEAYKNIFNKLNIKFTKVEGDPGNIGGILSHEYHFCPPSNCGEDKLIFCKNCEVIEKTNDNNVDKLRCKHCQNEDKISILNGIEVGHTFFLGDHYSKPFDAYFTNQKKEKTYFQMGCYGLGITRIIAASLEMLLLNENELRWPFKIAPYNIIVIPPKDGSKEQQFIEKENFINNFYSNLTEAFKNELVLDDRNNLTIGKRLIEAKTFGYPFIIVIGKQAIVPNNPKYELFDLNSNQNINLSENDLIEYINKYIQTENCSPNSKMINFNVS